MNRNQRTIKKSVSCTGIGLHTGVQSTVTFKPAPENYGIRFLRTDVENSPEIKADIDHVVDISRGTTLEQDGVRIHTVEHVLAAVTGLRIDNIQIELTGKEPPVMDGSALDFVLSLQRADFVEQTTQREVLKIDKAIAYSNPEKGIDIHVLPSDKFRVTFMIDYKYPSLGTQYTAVYDMEKNFPTEIAPARTFAFLSEIESLKEQGLIQGGNLSNAVVIVDKKIDKKEATHLRSLFGIKEDLIAGANGILNGKALRFSNEPVRHKALDLIGDLALLGLPIKGHVIAARSGHASNVEFVKKIKKEYQKKILQKKFQKKANSDYLLDINAIMNLIPHRYPFIMIDRIVDMTLGEQCTAIKNVTINEPFFQGHFPNQPVMPGVLILESMAQAGAFLVLNSVEDPMSKNMFFSAVNKSKFRVPVIPGDQIRIEMALKRIRLGGVKLQGKAYVGEKLVAEADLMANIVDRA
ncbi:MAG: bifunctional UDP-3-O-[3-hydroxymyristoyl] N-acetylglucosamine deacetylase/3-hydroxyacyl-ACP dehydratase [Candidatus Marinimicrobia bacterium]|nr:bifunctional UDP-3-O-[3-hydroxymyristoyl] N-acetylglucosamine deacetylase/3-hydroxyacyl-ACP dehydratase [Candidatus Neomarinimicrobiota bacterium]MBL7059810.1 bifunctional UDP-3-O-[3-hydroxymyristoyl] N-acetylglucosamine deacetylase/3-hydroxyacyl-ACP dehydratase [Candidatus Neomarinimicrobiota bacterium]